MSRRLVVGISGASGILYGVRLLEVLRDVPDWESHLVISRAAVRTLALELPEWPLEAVRGLADFVHDVEDLAAPLASGTFRTHGMVVAPCSMKTLSAVAQGDGGNLLTRAADVALKERRRLVLVPRESPLHLGHLKNMLSVTEMGAILVPPVVSFYLRPQSVLEVVDHTVGKVLDLFGLEHTLFQRWG